jgi:CBS domain-containing protein
MKTVQDFIVEIPVLKNNDQITKARQILRDDRFREIYVVDEKKNLAGYVDITDGLRVTATKSNVTVEGYIREAPMVNPGDSIEQAAKAMRTYRTNSAAIVDPAPRFRGAVLISDLFPVIISRNEMHGIVSDRMSTRVLAAKPSDELKKVYAMITESGFSAFPVVKKTCLVGMISRRDLISSRRVRTIVAEHAHSTVEHAMTREVITISSCEPVSAAAELLVKHDISRLPVIDEGCLVGIIDRHDVLASLV